MYWMKIDTLKESISQEEVLAINDNCEILIGYLRYDSTNKEIICQDDHQIMRGITHYVLQREIIKNFRKNTR